MLVALAVLLSTVVGFTVYSYTYMRQKQRMLEEKNAQVEEYNKQSTKISQEIDALKVRIKKIDRVGTRMSMTVFDQCTPNLYEVVLPIARVYESAGSFVVTEKETVGAEGCLTLAQYDELMMEGWTAAVRAPDAETDRKAYINAIRTHFESIGRDLPKAYYFPEGAFTEEELSFALKEGFNTFFYSIEDPYAEELVITVTDKEDPMYIPYMFMAESRAVFEKYATVMEDGGNCALSTGHVVSLSDINNSDVADRDFDSIIEKIKDVYDTLTAEFGYDRTVAEYRAEIYDAKVGLVPQRAQLQSEIDALVLRRDELKEKIAAVYGSEIK